MVMKVGYVTAEFLPNWGGIGTYSIELAKRMPGDIDFHVFTLRGHGQPPGLPRGFDRTFGENVHYHALGTTGDPFMSNAKFQLAVWRKLPRMQREMGLDLLHANHAQMSDILLKLSERSLPAWQHRQNLFWIRLRTELCLQPQEVFYFGYDSNQLIHKAQNYNIRLALRSTASTQPGIHEGHVALPSPVLG